MHRVLLLKNTAQYFQNTHLFQELKSLFSDSSGFLLVTLVTGCEDVPGGKKKGTLNGRVQGMLPFRGTPQLLVQNSPVMHSAQHISPTVAPAMCSGGEHRHSPTFNPSGGQYYTTEQALHSWLPLSLLLRKRIIEPCNDQNINGTSESQSFSSWYYPDLYISTDQPCFWNFPEVLTKSTKILMQRLHYQCNELLSPFGAQESCLPLLLGWLICHCLAFLNHPVRPSITVLRTPKKEVQPSSDTTCPELFTLTIFTESLNLKILKTWTSHVHSRQAAIRVDVSNHG